MGRLIRRGDLFDQSIHLADITETRAALLREQLAALDGMLRTAGTSLLEGANRAGRVRGLNDASLISDHSP